MAEAGMASLPILPVAVALVVVVSSWAFFLCRRYLLKPFLILAELRSQGVPGYGFRPLIGQVPELSKLSRLRSADPKFAARTKATEFLFEGHRRFGHVWTWALGHYPRLVISDPELVRAAVVSKSDNFQKSEITRFLTLLGEGLVTSNGPLWKRQRRLINPAFHVEAIQKLCPIMLQRTQDAIHSWKGLLAENVSSEEASKDLTAENVSSDEASKDLTAEGAPSDEASKDTTEGSHGTVLEMSKELNKLTLKIISETAFGLHVVGPRASELDKLQNAFDHYFRCISHSRVQRASNPIYAYLPTASNRKLWSSEKFIRGEMREIIKERLAGVCGKESEDKVDLLQLMIRSTEGSAVQQSGLSHGGRIHSSEGHEGRGHGSKGHEERGQGSEGHEGRGQGSEGRGPGSVHEERGQGSEGREERGQGSEGREDRGQGSEGREERGHGSEGHEVRGQGSGGHEERGYRSAVLTGAGNMMSVQQLMDESVTFLAAGHETVSNLLAWTMLLLGQHPEWQDKARDDVLSEGMKDWSSSFNFLSQRKVLNCVILECLRMYPPATAIIRTCVKDTNLAGRVTVPAGCDIFVPIEVIHYEPEFWSSDPSCFNPGRFFDGVSKAVKVPGAFMPFGLGPRICIGQNFAMVEARIIIALLLVNFTWRVSETYTHHPVVGVTLRPKAGMPILLTPRM